MSLAGKALVLSVSAFAVRLSWSLDLSLGSYNGYNYWVSDIRMDIKASLAYCQTVCAELFMPEDLAEAQHVHAKNLELGPNRGYFIAARYNAAEAVWESTYGRPLVVTFWDAAYNQPTNGLLEPCVSAGYGELMFWHDVGCSSNYAICKASLSEPQAMPTTGTMSMTESYGSKMAGKHLEGHVLWHVTSRSVLKCVALCQQTEQCRSVNYDKESRVCELNDVTAEEYPADLQSHATKSFTSLKKAKYVFCKY